MANLYKNESPEKILDVWKSIRTEQIKVWIKDKKDEIERLEYVLQLRQKVHRGESL